MKQTAGYFIVEASAMPEIFRKVAEAKRLLETGEETTVNRAAQAVGISAVPITSTRTRCVPSTICSMEGSSPFRRC